RRGAGGGHPGHQRERLRHHEPLHAEVPLVPPSPVAAPGSATGGSANFPESEHAPKIEVQHLSIRYAGRVALRPSTLTIARNNLHAIMGPAGSGKTSLLRAMNLLATEVDGAQITGRILLDGHDIFEPRVDVAQLRRRVGMVFAQPQPLP